MTCATFRTPDEDFGILLEAAVMYDRRVAAIIGEDDSVDEEVMWKEISDAKQCLYPRLLFIITGIVFLFSFCTIGNRMEFSNEGSSLMKAKVQKKKSMRQQ